MGSKNASETSTRGAARIPLHASAIVRSIICAVRVGVCALAHRVALTPGFVMAPAAAPAAAAALGSGWRIWPLGCGWHLRAARLHCGERLVGHHAASWMQACLPGRLRCSSWRSRQRQRGPWGSRCFGRQADGIRRDHRDCTGAGPTYIHSTHPTSRTPASTAWFQVAYRIGSGCRMSTGSSKSLNLEAAVGRARAGAQRSYPKAAPRRSPESQHSCGLASGAKRSTAISRLRVYTAECTP